MVDSDARLKRRSYKQDSLGRIVAHRAVVAAILLFHGTLIVGLLALYILRHEFVAAVAQRGRLAQFAVYTVAPVQDGTWEDAYAGGAVMLAFALLGSLYRTTREFVKASSDREDYPPCWYLTRPLQGALLAAFLYVALKAGGLAIYEGQPGVGVDPYSPALLGTLTGVFSEHAYQFLQGLMGSLFRTGSPPSPG